MIKRVYGWKKAESDPRNFKYAKMSMPGEAVISLPASTGNRVNFTTPFNQLTLGSCTANAGAALFRAVLKISGLPDFIPSRLFIYWFERYLQGTTKQDSGATITACLKVLAKYGVCTETAWPYDITKYKIKPPKGDIALALQNLAVTYQELDNRDLVELKTCLAAGFGIEFGFSVYKSFESAKVAKTGLAPIPGKREQYLGGHANVVVDYDDTVKIGTHTGAFYCLNSWGEQWGLNGYYWIPYAYLTNLNLASDFWTLRKVS